MTLLSELTQDAYIIERVVYAEAARPSALGTP